MKLILMCFIAAFLSLQVNERNNMRKTIPEDKSDAPLLSFGLIADPQYCDCPPAGTRFYRASLRKLTEATGVFKQEKVSFIISLGDLIDRDFSSFAPVLAILKSAGITTWHCTGNHDYNVEGGFKSRIPVLQHEKRGYYSFSVENFRFIFLNGNEISTYASADKEAITQAMAQIKKLTEEGAVNTFEWNGGMSREQITWLDAQLKTASSGGEKALIFCHFPIAPENIHNLLNCKDVLPVVENAGSAVAWFAGHNHEGNYTVSEGVHFITMKGMVETEAINTFSIVDVYPGRIEIKGYGNEISRACFFK